MVAAELGQQMHVIAENALDQTSQIVLGPRAKVGKEPDFVNTQAIIARCLIMNLAYPQVLDGSSIDRCSCLRYVDPYHNCVFLSRFGTQWTSSLTRRRPAAASSSSKLQSWRLLARRPRLARFSTTSWASFMSALSLSVSLTAPHSK